MDQESRTGSFPSQHNSVEEQILRNHVPVERIGTVATSLSPFEANNSILSNDDFQTVNGNFSNGNENYNCADTSPSTVRNTEIDTVASASNTLNCVVNSTIRVSQSTQRQDPLISNSSSNTDICITNSTIRNIDDLFNSPEFQLQSSQLLVDIKGDELRQCYIQSHYRETLYTNSSLFKPNMLSVRLQSQAVINRIIQYARYIEMPNYHALSCLSCGFVPNLPVTGPCGHTRCTSCIQKHSDCPCGIKTSEELHINSEIQHLIENIPCGDHSSLTNQPIMPSGPGNLSIPREHVGPIRHRHTGSLRNTTIVKNVPPCMPMAPQARLQLAQSLMSVGRNIEAAVHFARLIGTSESRVAFILLFQIITALCESREPRGMTRELCLHMRLQSAHNWIKASDLQCALCCQPYTEPVTTPCGHNFCRRCIERALDYRNTCPLCKRSLDNFNVATVSNTVFLSAALEAIGVVYSPEPSDYNFIPVFVCTVALPSIPCPIYIFKRRHREIVRCIINSPTRSFGILAREVASADNDYGTMVRVCDCVRMEDGSYMLATIGVSRFKVIERGRRDGFEAARIDILCDDIPENPSDTVILHNLASVVWKKAKQWFISMRESIRSEICSSFGKDITQLNYKDEEDWWENPDGPDWLWLLVAVLPLKADIKVLFLSTNSVKKRLMAVLTILELMFFEEELQENM